MSAALVSLPYLPSSSASASRWRLSVGDRPLLLRQRKRQSARCLLAAESADRGKHQLCCNPEKRVVGLVEGLATA
jgi:hypothetical protein